MSTFRIAAKTVLTVAAILPVAACSLFTTKPAATQPTASSAPPTQQSSPASSQPDMSAAERACPSDTTDAAAQGNGLPSWAQQGMAVCVPDSPISSGALSDIIINKTEYAVDVDTQGTGTLSWENGQASNFVAQVEDWTLSLSRLVANHTELILPPGEEAVLTPSEMGTYIDFKIGFDAVAYNTAGLLVDYLLDEGMKQLDIEGSSVIDDIKECAAAVTATTETDVYESQPLSAKVANLETRVVKCGSVISELKEQFDLGQENESGDAGDSVQEPKEPSLIDAGENFAFDVLGGLHPDGE